eukprot:230090-Hanusia_phi.AAC.2
MFETLTCSQRHRFPRSRMFEFKQGVGRTLMAMPTEVDPRDRVIRTSQLQMTPDATGFLRPATSCGSFVPAFVSLDGKVLRFVATMSDLVTTLSSSPHSSSPVFPSFVSSLPTSFLHLLPNLSLPLPSTSPSSPLLSHPPSSHLL